MDDFDIRLLFVNGFTELEAEESRNRGYLSHVLAEINVPAPNLFPLTFYDAVRLQQDLEESQGSLESFIACPGMIVLREISLEAMKSSVNSLYKSGFFKYMVPISREQLEHADPYQWPP